MKKSFFMISGILASLIFSGCGGGSSSEYDNPDAKNIKLYKLSEQNSTQNYLFYGEVNPKSLGSLSNVKVFSSNKPSVTLVENNVSSDISYPVSSTTMEYDATTKSYKNLYVNVLSYVENAIAYKVDMKKVNGQTPVAQSYQKVGKLSNADYEKIDYLGSKWYLTAHDDDANKTILISPDMSVDDIPVDIGNKKLLSVTFPSYGEKIDGFLMYDNDTKKVQKCLLSMSCQDISFPVDVGSRDFEADILGTTYSLFVIDDKLYKLNKQNLSVENIDIGSVKIASGHGTTDMQGGSFYFIGDDQNLYRVDLIKNSVIKITKQADDRIERIRGFTNNYVIFGSDTLLMAAKKDGTSSEPTLLAKTSKTAGYKYVTNYGVGDDYLFVTYSIDTKTNDTTYQACIFNEGAPECKKNSFWAGAVVKKEGTRDFESTFTYTPYAYIRVDDTDNFGGGSLKAIDPAHSLDDGTNMGTIEKYNFQTFLTNSRYIEETIDDDGGVVFFAKNDETYHVDAFYFNLLKENSLVQLTNTDPFPDVTHGRDHCHGRVCMICHNFAGGKTYTDLKGSKSAYGYRVKLDFEDGRTLLADVAKGKGENFSIPLKKMTGNFKVSILDANGTVTNSSAGYYHEGAEAANCNFCHARYGKMKYGAPGVISVTK